MLDDTEDLEDDDIEVGQRSVFRRIFKMGRGQPIRAADIRENKSYLSQFYSDLQTYCRKRHGTTNFVEDPKIFIPNSVNMNYCKDSKHSGVNSRIRSSMGFARTDHIVA